MSRVFQQALRRALGAPTRLDVLAWLSAVLVVALFIGSKVTERLIWGRHWHSFGRLDLAELGVLALAVGGCMWYVHRRMRQELDRAEDARTRALAIAAENAAVVQAVSAVVRELAQPVSGALSYSELLVSRPEAQDAGEQFERQGVRDGVLRIAALLQTVRATIDAGPVSAAQPHIAETVEASVTPVGLQAQPHSR